MITDFLIFDLSTFSLRFLIAFLPIIYIDFLSGIILLLTIIVYTGFSVIILNRRNAANIAYNTAEDIEKAHLSDSFTNIETVKYFGKEDYILKKYSSHGKTTKTKQEQLWGFGRWMVSGHTIIRSLGLTFLLISPVIRLVNGEITIGTLVFIYTLFLGVMGPLEHFSWSLRKMYTAIVDFDSLSMYLDIQKEVKDKQGAKLIKVKKGKIEFNNIKFSYDKRRIINN